MSKSGAFEVRCPDCDVTFPVGTKKCLHCGGRTTKPLRLPEGVYTSEDHTSSAPIEIMHLPKGQERNLPGMTESSPMEESPDDEEMARSPIRTIFNLLFIVLAIAVSAARACSEGQ